MVTDFSAAEKDRGAKFCMRVDLLSGQVFSPSGEHYCSRGIMGRHYFGIISGMYAAGN